MTYSTFWFTNSAYQELMRLAAQASDGLETGGLLWGYSYSGLGYLVVVEVTGPGPDSTREPCMFAIGRETCRTARAQRVRGHIYDIGDWHTHPRSRAIPSEGDDSGGHLYRQQCGPEWPNIMTIVAVPPCGSPGHVGAWYYADGARTELEVKVADADWQPPFDERGEYVACENAVAE